VKKKLDKVNNIYFYTILFFLLILTSSYSETRFEKDLKKLSKYNYFVNSDGNRYELDKNINKFSTIFISKINSILSYFIPRKIIVCADSAKSIHIKNGFSPQKFITIPNGIDLNKFKRSSQKRSFFRNKLNIKSNETLYGTVARFHPIKDHITLIKSISRLKKAGYKFKYLLVGDNINNKNKLLNELIKKYRLEENMILLEKEENISLVMNALDLHVLSSKSEALPMVILEAMGCGTPCLSTNVGDVKKLIFDNNLIVETSNQSSLFSAMKIFSDYNSKYKNQISISVENQIKENYSLEKMTQKYLNLYQKYTN